MDENQATPRPPETPEFGLVDVGGPVHDYPSDTTFRVRKVAVGPYENNVYTIVSGDEALIVDGADEPDRIGALVEGLTVTGIVQTHNHADHVQALPALVAAFDAPVYAHPEDPPPVPFTPIGEGDSVFIAGGETHRLEASPDRPLGFVCVIPSGIPG